MKLQIKKIPTIVIIMLVILLSSFDSFFEMFDVSSAIVAFIFFICNKKVFFKKYVGPRQLSGSRQVVIKQSSGSRLAVVRHIPEWHQSVIRLPYFSTTYSKLPNKQACWSGLVCSFIREFRVSSK